MSEMIVTVVPFHDGKVCKEEFGNFHKVQSVIADPKGFLADKKETYYLTTKVKYASGAQVSIDLDDYKLVVKPKNILIKGAMTPILMRIITHKT
jgi:hypothetical protein